MPENIWYITQLKAHTATKVTAMLCLTDSDVNVCVCLVLGWNTLQPKYRGLETLSTFQVDAQYKVLEEEYTPHYQI